MSGSTPKKPVLNRENKSSSSFSDFCRLCKCSFKTIYGNFPSKNISGELSGERQPKTSYISTENIFYVSCRKGEERPSLNSILERLGFSVLRIDTLSSRGFRKCAIKVRNADRGFALFDRNLIARITSSNRNSKREIPARTKKIMTRKKDSSECQSPHALRSNSSFLTCSSAILRSGTKRITAGITLSIAFFATQ